MLQNLRLDRALPVPAVDKAIFESSISHPIFRDGTIGL
jgi:hypothetical protein